VLCNFHPLQEALVDYVTINLEDKNRISLVMESITLELVVKRPTDVIIEMRADQLDTVSLSLEETKKRQIRRVLDLCKGNKSWAAQILGISRVSLWRYQNRNPRTVVSDTLRRNGSTSTNGEPQSELLSCFTPGPSPRVHLCPP
jgi:DNA-binding NtrC family response regulator